MFPYERRIESVVVVGMKHFAKPRMFSDVGPASPFFILLTQAWVPPGIRPAVEIARPEAISRNRFEYFVVGNESTRRVPA